MRFFTLIFVASLLMSMSNCKSSSNTNVAVVEDMSQSEMEAAILKRENNESLPLIDRVDLQSPTLNKRLTADDFEAKLVFMGKRTIAGQEQDVKIKLFVWGEGKYLRGYYQPRYLKEDIPFLGMMKGNEIALKTRAPYYLMEDGANLVGTLDGSTLKLMYTKEGQSDIPFEFEETDREYEIIYYATEDNQ